MVVPSEDVPILDSREVGEEMVDEDSDDVTVKDAFHLPIIDVTVQNKLEASLRKTTVIVFDIESVGGGGMIPVMFSRRAEEVPSKILIKDRKYFLQILCSLDQQSSFST